MLPQGWIVLEPTERYSVFVAEDQPGVIAMADKKPSSANEVLASVNDDHDWRNEPIDLNTTGGIKRACERNADAIQALADYIDGKSTRAMPGYEAPKDAPKTVTAFGH